LACILDESVPETNNGSIIQFKVQLFACMRLHIPIEIYELDSFKGINIEHKRFLPMDKEYYNNTANSCLYLTIGIGNHTQAEKEFLKIYPRCKLFGVEILASNVWDFATFGKVINAGIGLLDLIIRIFNILGFGGKVEILDHYTYDQQTMFFNLTLKPLGMISLNYLIINLPALFRFWMKMLVVE
jgi:hypothetical protein